MRLEQMEDRSARNGYFNGGARLLEVRDNGETVFEDLSVGAKDMRTDVASMSEKVSADGWK